jgi:hypothetical protein
MTSIAIVDAGIVRLSVSRAAHLRDHDARISERGDVPNPVGHPMTATG